MNKLLEDQGTGTIGQRDWYNDFDKAKEDRLRKIKSAKEQVNKLIADLGTGKPSMLRLRDR